MSEWGWGSPAGQIRVHKRYVKIRDGAGLKAGMRVLEIGCGTGLFTEMFAQSQCSIVAVDLSRELIDKARNRCPERHNIQYVVQNFNDLEDDNCFDAIIGSSVLHHLDVESSLVKMFDLLKPGGWISFAEPNLLNPQVFLERKFRSFFPYVSPDEIAFVRKKLTKTLDAVGFKAIQIIPFDWLHPATPISWIPLVTRVGAFLEKTPLVREFAGSLHLCAQRSL